MSTSYEFYHDDVTVTSFINISLDIATLPLKSSHKEQPSAVDKRTWRKCHSVWDASSIFDKYFTRPAIRLV